MATPAYQGANQPPADNGGSLFGRLGSFFVGGGTPTYAVVTSPKDSQTTEPKGTNVALAPQACPIDPTCCPIDPAAIAAGQIAIVIPRERLVCSENAGDPTAQ